MKETTPTTDPVMTPPTDALCLVLTTLPVGHDTEALVRHLLDAHLIACASVHAPIRSVYRWQGTVESAEEQQVVFKTRAERLPALEVAVKDRHPYDVPEWLVVPVSAASAAYGAWIRSETRS